MESISMDNYEAFLLDYMEGRLDSETEQALRAFAITHPELGIELEDVELAYLSPETEKHSLNKQPLFKTEDDLLLNNELLNYFEGDLALSQKISFEEKLRTSKELTADLNMLRKTRLEPDLSIVFERKHKLKKGAKVIALNVRVISRIAAAVTLIAALGIVFKLNRRFNQMDQNTAQAVPLKSTKAMTPLAESRTPASEKSKLVHTSDNQFKGAAAVPEKKVSMPASVGRPSSVIPAKEALLPDPVTNIPEEERLVAVNANDGSNEAVQSAEISAVAVIEESMDDDEPLDISDDKRSFWKKAVQFARRANNLGVTSIDGHETGHNQFRLSFNSFSVEKK